MVAPSPCVGSQKVTPAYSADPRAATTLAERVSVPAGAFLELPARTMHESAAMTVEAFRADRMQPPKKPTALGVVAYAGWHELERNRHCTSFAPQRLTALDSKPPRARPLVAAPTGQRGSRKVESRRRPTRAARERFVPSVRKMPFRRRPLMETSDCSARQRR